MEAFPFLLVEFEAVEDFSVVLNGFELRAVVGVIAGRLALFLLDFIDVDDLRQFLQSISHADRHLVVPFERVLISTF